MNDKITASVGAKQTCLPSIISNIANDVITEYSRLSSLLAVRDDSQERRLRNCQFHTDVVKSLIYKSAWTGKVLFTNRKQKVTKVN